MTREDFIFDIACIDWHTGRSWANALRTAERIVDNLYSRGLITYSEDNPNA